MNGWASCDLPALVITNIPTDTGEEIDWLWYGGTVTIRWFWKTSKVSWSIISCMYSTLEMGTLFDWIYLMKEVHVDFCFGLPRIIIWNIQRRWKMFYSTANKKCTHRQKDKNIPATFSWKITLVPLRKFFPIIKTSSPPLTEQLWRLFFRISGTPAGWAGRWENVKNANSPDTNFLTAPKSTSVAFSLNRLLHKSSYHLSGMGWLTTAFLLDSIIFRVRVTHCRGWGMRGPVR